MRNYEGFMLLSYERRRENKTKPKVVEGAIFFVGKLQLRLSAATSTITPEMKIAQSDLGKMMFYFNHFLIFFLSTY
jgi:hypothetical protein